MHRIWFVVLALSLGLNAGLLYERHVAHAWLAKWGGPPGSGGEREHPGAFGRAPVCGMLPRHRCDPETMNRRHLERMSRILELTPEQREEMEAIFRESIKDLLAAQEEVGEIRHALRDLFLAAEIDTAQVHELVARLTEARGRVESIVSGNIVREAALLTPEQKARYIESLPWTHGRRGKEAGPPHGKETGPPHP